MAFTRRKNGVSRIVRDTYRKKPATGQSDWWEIADRVRERDNYTCTVCGKYLGPGRGDIDHIRELSRGGTTTMSNLRLLCNGVDGCHARKHHHLFRRLVKTGL